MYYTEYIEPQQSSLSPAEQKQCEEMQNKEKKNKTRFDAKEAKKQRFKKYNNLVETMSKFK